MQTPMPQEIYRHFKGNLYQIVTIAKHSETGEELVIYQALYGDYGVYARPLSMFMSPVDKNKYPEVVQKNRFEKVQQPAFIKSSSVEQEPVQAEQASLAPGLMAFLDADTYEKRLEILTGMRDSVTDEMLTTMAIACDIELKDGPIADRYEELKGCLITLERFECNRLR